MLKRVWVLGAACLLTGMAWGAQPDKEVLRAAAAAWVEEHDVFREPSPVDENSPEMEYLLSDRQVDLASEQNYYHTVVYVAKEEGLQSAGRWSVVFDPQYQQVTVHRIRVHRDGEVLNRLDMAEFRYLEQEESADWHIYDGNVTAMTLLEDVRVGDTVEFAYTVAGWNPVFAGRYSEAFSLGWGTSVRELFLAVNFPPERELVMRQFGPEVRVERLALESGEQRWQWHVQDTPVPVYEEATPSWYSVYPWVVLSEYPDWQAVVNWALPLYAAGDVEPEPELLQEVAGLAAAKGAAPGEERILQLLDYAQGEIRYVGIELGESSHQPHDPSETHSRRFGDCKDKTLLLVQLLRHEGYEAYPVLVDTSGGPALDSQPASPGAFDHVIVGLVLDGEWHWVDPTMSPRPGDLASRAANDYGQGLVIKAGETRPRQMQRPAAATSSTICEEIIRVGNFGGASTMRVSTAYRGNAAARVENVLQSTAPAQIQQDYQEYYASVYPDVVMPKAADWWVDPDGTLQVVEDYRIKDIWQRNEAPGMWWMETYASLINDQLPWGISTERRAPREVTHPVTVQLMQRLEMPETWIVDLPTERVETPWFELVREVRNLRDRVFEVEYRYRSLAGHVEPEDMERYAQALDEAHELLGLELSKADEIPGWLPGEEGGTPFVPNLLMFLIAAGALAGGLGLVVWWARAAQRRGPPMMPGQKPPALGGWLILPALGTAISPISVAFGIYMNLGHVFDQTTWMQFSSATSDFYDPILSLVMLIEVVAHAVLYAIILANLWMFFGRYRCAPRLFQAILVFNFVILLGDFVVGIGMDYYTNDDIVEVMGELLKLVIGMVIWIPYFAMSKRVKRTFIR